MAASYAICQLERMGFRNVLYAGHQSNCHYLCILRIRIEYEIAQLSLQSNPII